MCALNAHATSNYSESCRGNADFEETSWCWLAFRTLCSPNSASFHSQLNSFSHKIVICDKVVLVIIMTVRLFQMIFSQLWRSTAYSQPWLVTVSSFWLGRPPDGNFSTKSLWLCGGSRILWLSDSSWSWRLTDGSVVSPSLSKCLFHSRVTRHAIVCPTLLCSLPRRHDLQATCV